MATALAAPLAAPLREDQHPTYLDAADQVVAWKQVASVARSTDVMGRIRGRRAGRNALRVLFTGAAAAETYATVQLFRNDNDWAWPLAAQTAFTTVAAGLLWAEVPRRRRIERALMLDAANAYLRTAPTAPSR